MYRVGESVEFYVLRYNRWADAVIVGRPGDYEDFPHYYGVEVPEYPVPRGFLPWACAPRRIRPKRGPASGAAGSRPKSRTKARA